jgi:hypothetical protein
MFKNLPLLVKQMIYFSCITLILVVVGLVGLFGMRNVGTRAAGHHRIRSADLCRHGDENGGGQ